MDEETSQIKQHINDEREQLGRNLHEIEDRVQKATDLKTHFNRNTGWILGAAVAGGFLLSCAFNKRSPAVGTPGWEQTASEPITSATSPFRTSHLDRVSETLDNIFEGLVAVASDKLRSFVGDVVPGFHEQFEDIQRQHGTSAVHQMRPKVRLDSDTAAR